MVHIFNIEGNIGSGKSTFVRILEKEMKSIILMEILIFVMVLQHNQLII